MTVRSAAEIVAAAKAAGFPDPVTAAAYAGIESGWDDSAVSSTGCCGAWQLCPCVGNGDLQANANAAYQKFHAAGDSWRDWTPYDGGSANPQWGHYLSQAQGASGTPAAPSGSSGQQASGSGGGDLFAAVFGHPLPEIMIRAVEVLAGGLILAMGLTGIGIVVIGGKRAATGAALLTPIGRGAKLGSTLAKSLGGKEAASVAEKGAARKATTGTLKKAAGQGLRNYGMRPEQTRDVRGPDITEPAERAGEGASRRTRPLRTTEGL